MSVLMARWHYDPSYAPQNRLGPTKPPSVDVRTPPLLQTPLITSQDEMTLHVKEKKAAKLKPSSCRAGSVVTHGSARVMSSMSDAFRSLSTTSKARPPGTRS